MIYLTVSYKKWKKKNTLISKTRCWSCCHSSFSSLWTCSSRWMDLSHTRQIKSCLWVCIITFNILCHFLNIIIHRCHRTTTLLYVRQMRYKSLSTCCYSQVEIYSYILSTLLIEKEVGLIKLGNSIVFLCSGSCLAELAFWTKPLFLLPVAHLLALLYRLGQNQQSHFITIRGLTDYNSSVILLEA